MCIFFFTEQKERPLGQHVSYPFDAGIFFKILAHPVFKM